MKQPTEHKGILYFPSRQAAYDRAESRGWPTDRINHFSLGWAIQAGPSGNYMGRANTPKPWRGWTHT